MTAYVGTMTTRPSRLGARERLVLLTLPVFQVLVTLRSVPAVAGLLVALALVCGSDRWRGGDKIAACLIAPATVLGLMSSGSGQMTICPDLVGYDCDPGLLVQVGGMAAAVSLLALPLALTFRGRQPAAPQLVRERTHVDAAVLVLLSVALLIPLWVDSGDPFAAIVMIPTLVVLATCVALLWRSTGWHPRDKGVATAVAVGCLTAQLWLYRSPWRLCADYPPDFVAEHYGVACQTATETAGIMRWSVYVAAFACAAFLYLRHRRA